MGIFSAASSSIRKRFSDNFIRSDSSDIGEMSDGTLWKKMRGSLGVSSNNLSATTASSEYPMVAVDTPFANASIEISGATQGATAALWITDSGNWWGVKTEQITTSCDCTSGYTCTSTGCTTTGCTVYGCQQVGCTGGFGCKFYGCTDGYGCTQYGCTGGYGCKTYGCTSTGCIRYSGSFCVAYGCKTTGCTSTGCLEIGCTKTGCLGTGCTGYGCVQQGCVVYGCDTYGCTGYGCTGGYAWSSCNTCYPQYIRLIQSVSSVVSTVTSWSVSSVVNALRVKTSDKTVVVEVFGSGDLTNQIGTAVEYTVPSGTQTDSRYGLAISPSDYNQGSSITGISIERN